MSLLSRSYCSEVEGGSDAQQSGAAHNVRDERSANYSIYHFRPDHTVVMSRAAVTRSKAKWLTMSETSDRSKCSMYHFSPDYTVVKSRAAVTRSVA